jgi:Pentapeptide repeats (8 copies)
MTFNKEGLNTNKWIEIRDRYKNGEVDFRNLILQNNDDSFQLVKNDFALPLRGVDFGGSVFYGDSLSGSRFENTNFKGCSFFRDAILPAELLNCDLRGASFGRIGMNLKECNNFDGTLVDDPTDVMNTYWRLQGWYISTEIDENEMDGSYIYALRKLPLQKVEKEKIIPIKQNLLTKYLKKFREIL